jgi:hypothetical protein
MSHHDDKDQVLRIKQGARKLVDTTCKHLSKAERQLVADKIARKMCKTLGLKMYVATRRRKSS